MKKLLLVSAGSLAIFTTIAFTQEVEVYNQQTNEAKYYDLVSEREYNNRNDIVIYDYDTNKYYDIQIKKDSQQEEK